jgi:hypothetical protein
MSRTKPVPEHQKGKQFDAFNVVFVVKLGNHQFIEVPANYCGIPISTRKIRKSLRRGKTILRHFHDEDQICPKNFNKVHFLGPKVKSGYPVVFPEPFSEARHLEPREKYLVSEVRLRHAV